MPKIVVSVKHINSDLAPAFTQVRFIKEFEPQATDIRFESGAVANIARLSLLNQNFKLLEASLRRLLTSDVHRVQFVYMDDSNVENNCEINTLCYQYSAQLVLCWSFADLARYIESFAERPEVVQGRQKRRLALSPAEVLALIPQITAPDAANLLATFGSLKGVASAEARACKVLRGISEGKASALASALQKPLT